MTLWSDVTPTCRLGWPERRAWLGGSPSLPPSLPHTQGGLGGSFRPHVNLHTITQEALRLDFTLANSHPFCVINKIGDRKLIQPSDALFMLHHTVMIDLQQLIHANYVWALNVKIRGGEGPSVSRNPEKFLI